MFNWTTYWIFALAAGSCWTAGSVTALCRKVKPAWTTGWLLAGIALYALFMGGFWFETGHPPLATQGETRLWFPLFLIGTSLLIYRLWRYRGIVGFSTLMAIVFMLLNILKPEIQTRELMPALQSMWFIPHVTLYMISYAFLCSSFILSLLWLYKKSDNIWQHSDEMVRMGMILFTTALFIGSVWAQEAWGHFWTWDLKETWALITSSLYVIYITYRKLPKQRPSIACLILICGFIALQIGWYGVKYLPAANSSLHVYQ